MSRLTVALFSLSVSVVGATAFVAGCTSSTESSDTASPAASDENDLRGVSRCGGIAGLRCAGSLTCVDDPIDSCDPQNGGADCPGICVNAKTAPACGGIAGLSCASGLRCVDDPTDSCDPGKGGADCSGICVKAACDPKLAVTATCAVGTQFDTTKCACIPPTSVPTCKTLTCESGYHCEEKGINGGTVPACIKDDKTDCRSSGCGKGSDCSFCWGTYACIPKGAQC